MASLEETYIDFEGKQFMLEIKKLIKNAFYTSYLGANKSKVLLSEYTLNQNFKDLLPTMATSESYSFLNHYLGVKNGKVLPRTIQNVFETTKNEICDIESKKEIKKLESRAELVQKVLRKSVFDTTENKNSPFHLLQGLGLKYGGGKISYLNSNKHFTVPFSRAAKISYE